MGHWLELETGPRAMFNSHTLLWLILCDCFELGCSSGVVDFLGSFPCLCSLLLLLLFKLLLQVLLRHHLLLLSDVVVLKEIKEVEAWLSWLTSSCKASSACLRSSPACFASSSCISSFLSFSLSCLLCGSLCCTLVGTNRSLSFLVHFCLLCEDGELHKMVKLGLGALHIRFVNLLWGTHLFDDFVCLLLKF